MKNKITADQIKQYNKWQERTDKRPLYGAIDINQLDLFVSNLQDVELYEETKAQKIASDFLLLVSEYLNNARIEEIENVVNVCEYSTTAVAMFKRFKPMFDSGFICFMAGQTKTEFLNGKRKEKREQNEQQPPQSKAQIIEFCNENKLFVTETDILKFWNKNEISNFENVGNWRGYFVRISESNRQKELLKFKEKVIAENRTKIE